MPSEETLRNEAEMAAKFERSDARQKNLGIRLDKAPSRANKGRQQSKVARAADDMDMKSRGRYMAKKRKRK